MKSNTEYSLATGMLLKDKENDAEEKFNFLLLLFIW